MKRDKIFWGIFFILAAVAIVLFQTGLLADMNLWALIVSIFMLPIIVQSVFNLNFWGIFFPAAAILAVNSKHFGLEHIGLWTCFAVAFFLSIGFSMIFSRHTFHCTHRHKNHEGHDYHETVEYLDDSVVNCSVSFGAASKHLHSASLQQANLYCRFGALKVFLDGTQLHPNGAHVAVDCSFGAIQIHIPKAWQVKININTILGGVDEKNKQPILSGPTLTLEGEVQLGGIEIIYV